MKTLNQTPLFRLQARAALALLALTGAGCGVTSGFAGTGVRSYLGSAGPGDVWEWTLDYVAGTFVARVELDGDGTYDLRIEGDLESLPSGFVKGTPTDADAISSSVTQAEVDSEVPTDGSGFFYGIEAPGLVFIIKPEGSIKGDLIATVAKDGECVRSNYNWVQLGFNNSNNSDVTTSGDVFGTAEFTGPFSGMTLDGEKYNLGANFADGNPVGALNPPTTITCENGEMRFADGGTVEVGQITPAGAMMIDNGPGNGGIVAFEQSDVSLDAMTDGVTYSGVLFKPNKNSDTESDEIHKPVQLKFNASGTSATGKEISDVETGELASEAGVTVAFTSITNGLLRGTIDYGSGGKNLAAIGYKTGDTRVLFLTGIDDDNTSPFMVLLVGD